MGRRVYLETSVVSYLAALPSRDVVVAGNQQVTRDWWARRSRFELFVSDAVLEEARRGDGDAARRRLGFLDGVPVLAIHPDAEGLAGSFLSAAALPSKAAIDAVHVALSAVHGMDFLVTLELYAHRERHHPTATRGPVLEGGLPPPGHLHPV